MKKPKTYRFGPDTMAYLDKLKEYAKKWDGIWTETDIIEHAIGCLYADVQQHEKHQPI